MKLRIGLGVDVHRFAKQRKLVLAGVEIPCDLGLEGHSDADVVTHALIDALLGASGSSSDIGVLFPNTDEEWKDANSLVMLSEVWCTLRDNGWEIQNIDCCLLAEFPRLSPYFSAMKESLAGVLGIAEEQVSIKATTNEKLGYIGRGEGIFAEVVVLMSGQ